MMRETAMLDDNPRAGPAAAAAGEPPRPDPAFHWTSERWGHALRATPLEPHAQHLFTSSQLRLPANAGEADRERAWAAITESLGTPRQSLWRVRQVHGRAVKVVPRADPSGADPGLLPDGDALVSNRPGATLAVVVADCVPVLMVDPRAGAAAAVHAGWRGTCAAVTRAAVAAMRDAWGSEAGELWAAIGPSIGPADYQVGEPLVEDFRRAGHGEAVGRWFTRAGDGSLRLDLWRANVEQLVAEGVRPERICVAGLSTVAHPGWLESYRRDGACAGRLVAAIVVPRPAA